VYKLYQRYGTFASLFLSKPCQPGWLTVVNALLDLELASDGKGRDGIFRQGPSHPSITTHDLLQGVERLQPSRMA
jgi:hypothetical protein